MISILLMTIIAGADSQKNIENISIGALIPITGDWATNGEQSEDALDVGLVDVNRFLENIGSDNRVILAVEDTRADPAIAQKKLAALHDQGINIVIVTGTSRELQAMKDYADEEGVLLIASGSSAPSLAISGDNIYRVVPDDDHLGVAMGQVFASFNISAIVPMARFDVWAIDLLRITEKSFSAKNGTALNAIRYAPDSADYSASVHALSKRVKEAVTRYGADRVGVYLVSFDEGSKIMALAAMDPVLSSVKWFGSDGIANRSDLVNNSTVAAFTAKTGFIAPIFSGEDDRQLFKDVSNSIRNAAGSEPNAYAVTAYDALWIATEAELLTGNGSISQLKVAFEQIANSYCGATGRTMLNQAGDRDFADYSLLEVKETDGKYVWKKVGQFYSDNDERGFVWIK